MLKPDSLVIDVIFQRDSVPEPEALIEALGGQDEISSRTIVDPDMQDPRFEMELSPSMPFRQRDERRLLIIDNSVAPMRADPRADSIIPIDLRPEKQRLLALCEAADVRFGRLFALGSWGDAVLVARNAQDLRGISLLSWALDPLVDVSGQRRATPLSQPEFEEKIAAYPKRLEERDEQTILADLGPATFTRQGSFLIVDVLEADGTWDIRKSLELEASLAAIRTFAHFPGAKIKQTTAPEQPPASPPVATQQPQPAEQTAVPLRFAELAEQVVLVFPPERFNLDIAAAFGKSAFDDILSASDKLPGPIRDRIFRWGADFIAPLEFLSEVFIDGVPLTRATFERDSEVINDNVRVLNVHCPRFGPVTLFDLPGAGRFISSSKQSTTDVAALISRAAR